MTHESIDKLKNVIINTVLAAVLISSITMVGGFVYSSNAEIRVIGKDIQHISESLKQVNKTLEISRRNTELIALLQQDMETFKLRVIPLIQDNKLIYREDWSRSKKEIVEYVNQNIKEIREHCFNTIKQ